jgi:hypothetical protein
MNQETQIHIENALGQIKKLFEDAAEVIEAIKPGEKIPATVLAEQVAERHGMNGPSLYPVLKFLFNGFPGILVKAGAHGGLIRPPAEK